VVKSRRPGARRPLDGGPRRKCARRTSSGGSPDARHGRPLTCGGAGGSGGRWASTLTAVARSSRAFSEGFCLNGVTSAVLLRACKLFGAWPGCRRPCATSHLLAGPEAWRGGVGPWIGAFDNLGRAFAQRRSLGQKAVAAKLGISLDSAPSARAFQAPCCGAGYVLSVVVIACRMMPCRLKAGASCMN